MTPTGSAGVTAGTSTPNAAANHFALLSDGLEDKLARLAARAGEAQASAVLQWLAALNDEDPASALAVIERLDHLLAHVDQAGLGRWLLTGARLYPRDLTRQRQYFRLDDPRAVQALHAEAGAGELAAHLPTLALLLHGLSGRPLEVQGIQNRSLHGPPQRPILTTSHLLLPDDYTQLDGQDIFRVHRAAVAHAVAHLRHSPRGQPTLALKPMSVAVISALEDARVERLLVRDYPGVRTWFLEFAEQAARPHSLDFESLIGRMDRALMDASYEDDNHWVNKARRLFEEAATDLSDYTGFRRIASILANDLGQMRVRFQPQHDVVAMPYRDDNSFLWDFGANKGIPPEELELHVRRQRLELGQPGVDGQHQPDSSGAAHVEVELGRSTYPEWDHRMSRARTDWCTVVDKLPNHRLPGASPGTATDDRMARPLSLLRSRRLSRTRRLRRQWEGDEVDLNAAVEMLVDQRAGLSPDPRLFVRPSTEDQRSSILVLLDLSESTNDCVGGTMQSILDIEKRAALMLARSVDDGHDRIAIHGFSSNTRSEINYYRLLDFGAPLTASAATTIARMPGRWSTRLGAAIRHATTLLKNEHVTHRAIVVITDGEPSDVDVFDADYLIEDARVASLDAARAAIRTYGVVLDSGAGHYAQRIFGWNNYLVVEDPLRLPQHLAALFGRLSRS